MIDSDDFIHLFSIYCVESGGGNGGRGGRESAQVIMK